MRTQTDTIYDLASLSKLFTTIVAMQLVDQGRLDLDAPVVSYLPAFAAHGKGDITIRQLLTHTSGFAPDPIAAAVAAAGRPARGRHPRHRAGSPARHARTCTPT